MLVKEIMIENVVTIGCDATILEACNKYRDCKVGCLVITDKEKCVGIVTERDLIERTICRDTDPREIKVRDIMSTDLEIIDPLDRVEKALDLLKKLEIKKLPVISNDVLVGIVTVTDIAYTRPDIREFLEIRKK